MVVFRTRIDPGKTRVGVQVRQNFQCHLDSGEYLAKVSS